MNKEEDMMKEWIRKWSWKTIGKRGHQRPNKQDIPGNHHGSDMQQTSVGEEGSNDDSNSNVSLPTL